MNFEIFIPKLAPETKYAITGPDCQILTVNLHPGETLESEPGSMMFMSPDIKTILRCGKLSRLCTGETLCKTIFTNHGSTDAYVALTPNFPAKIVPVDLVETGTMVLKNGSYMSALGEISLTADVDCCSFTCCCGGLGFIRQNASGSGTVFLTAGGTVLTKTLADNETIIVDSNAVVGFQKTVKFGVRRAGGCCTMCCGGEGFFNSTLTGPGLVILESMSFEKYRQAVAPPAQGGDGGAGTGGLEN